MVNSSHSLQVLGEQSSVYVPISNLPKKLPSYVTLDSASKWHIGALQVIGIESMTISSRLRTSIGNRGMLQDLEDTVNSTGKRRIAKLEMSIADPDVLSEQPSHALGQAERVGSMTSGNPSESDEDLSTFDVDTFARDYRVTSRPRKHEHIFGRAESFRGNWDLSEDNGDRDPHDRFNRGPAVQRYVVVLDPVSERLRVRGPPCTPVYSGAAT